MKRENFYRRDPLAALNGMIGLSLEERSVYNTIIDLLYSTWRPIEDNRQFIANWCGCAVQRLNPIMAKLIEKGRLIRFQEGACWYVTDGKFERERTAVKGPKTPRENGSGRGEVGEKSGEVGHNPPLRDTDNQEKQSLTALDKTREEKKPPNPLEGGRDDLFGEAKPGPGKPERRKPMKAIPDGYPDAEAIETQRIKAAAVGADVDMAYQAERFRNWALGKDARYADWSKTWANWCGRQIREAPKTRRAASTSAPADQAGVWRRRVEAYLHGSRYWNTNDWGAKPGHDGCIVPGPVLAEFGLGGAEILPFPAEPRAA